MPKKQAKRAQISAVETLLKRGVAEILPDAKTLAAKLAAGRPLRVKLGIDPTGPRLHLGHAVILWKLKEFQDLGHWIILVMGDFTARIGDPSDKLGRRPVLTEPEIKANLKTYRAQIGKILNLKKTEFCLNSAWLGKLKAADLIKLAQLVTVNQMLARRNFAERYAAGHAIQLQELLYPLLQAYDSVAVKADVELGGTDQLFNLTMGRTVQAAFQQKPQTVLIVNMLLGTDGRKMSKSWGNVVNIADSPPNDMFGKLMAMGDEQISEYGALAARLTAEEIDGLKRLHPKTAKQMVAERIVALYHGARQAKKARLEFKRIFQKKGLPSDAPQLKLAAGAYSIVDLAIYAGLAKSRGEAKRLLNEGAYKVGGEVARDPFLMIELKSGEAILLQCGKRKFIKIKVQ